MLKKIKKAAAYIRKKSDIQPLVGIVLGSGLGNLAQAVEVSKTIPYHKIPGFPVSTVEGHKGSLVMGQLSGKPVVVMQGRFHYYEGYPMQQVVFGIRMMKLLGISYLIVSNAAGGLNPEYNQGDLMLIRDHINFFPENPLRGQNIDRFGPRFPDMSKTYSPRLLQRALEIGKANEIELRSGVYVGSSGPTLETPAEYNMFRILGADATGMSTVPEVIVAHHAGIECFGVSVITNVSRKDQIPATETTHEEVQEVAGLVEPKLTLLIKELVNTLE